MAVLASSCASSNVTRVSSVGAVAARTQDSNTARVRFKVDFYDDIEPSIGEGSVDFVAGDGRIVSSPGPVIWLTKGGEQFLGPQPPPKKGPRWVRLPRVEGGGASSITGQMNPALLVGELKKLATGLTPRGSGRVRGVPTTAYEFTIGRDVDRPVVLLLPLATRSKAVMDVDDAGRLRRLVVTAPEPARAMPDDKAYPPLSRLELELWDFGVNVSLRAPDPKTVVDFDDPRAGELLSAAFPLDEDEDAGGGPPDDSLSGPYSKLASGVWDDVTWEMWEAPLTDGRVCMTFEPTPPPDPQAYPMSSGDSLDRGANDASCFSRPDLFEEGDPIYTFDYLGDGDYWYLAGITAPEIARLTVTLRGGKRLEVPVDPTTHVFALFNRQPQKIAEITANAGTNTRIRCVPDPELGLLECSGTTS